MRPPLNDRQIGRMVYRIALFQRRGRNESEAEILADRLADRDYDLDTRRLCLECSNLQQDGGCFAAQQKQLRKIMNCSSNHHPVPDILHNCPCFTWQKP